MALFRSKQNASGDDATQKSQAFYSTLVVEHIVDKEKSAAFEQWHCDLQRVAETHAGFVRLDLSPPLVCEDDAVKWYGIVHFDSPESLNSWVESSARKQAVEEGQAILSAYRFKSFTTGLEGWFSKRTNDKEKRGLGPPAWKQILSVVFGLYPIVMIRIKLFPNTGIIGEWSPSGAMLLATLVTSSILAIVVMPIVTGFMRFWLYPAYREHDHRADIVGSVIMVLGLVCMVALFDQIGVMQ